jgi:hypothetical protein
MPRMRPHKSVHRFVLFRFNFVVKVLMFTDGLVWAGYFMNNAIVAVYLNGQLGLEAVQ